MPSRRRYKTGRPTKRTKEVVKVLFDAIKEGVPFKLACMAAGISYECFTKWRNKDPDFDRQVDELVAKPAINLFKIIREQAPENWQAGAWSLERRFPEMFAKPEAQLQLNVLAQAAVINGNGASNVRAIVVSDLEFVGLKRHPAYKHRLGPEREAEQIPAELSGTLERDGNIVVVSESTAALNAQRFAEIRAHTLKLLGATKADTGNGQTESDHHLAAGDLSPVHPAPEPAPRFPIGWWRQFVFATETDALPKEDVIQCIEMVLAELGISTCGRLINFPGGTVTGGELQKSLEDLTGGQLGWSTLVSLYQKEYGHGRTDHQS